MDFHEHLEFKSGKDKPLPKARKEPKDRNPVPNLVQVEDVIHVVMDGMNSQTNVFAYKLTYSYLIEVNEEETLEQQDSHISLFPTEYSREIVNPREAVLPASWNWLEGSGSETLKCLRFLKADGKLRVIKMIYISGETIAYYVKGRLITNNKLQANFSTLAELNEAISTFENITVCPGVMDAEVFKVKELPSGIKKKNYWRSNACRYVGEKNDMCCECAKTFILLKRRMKLIERLVTRKKLYSPKVLIRNAKMKLLRRNAKLHV
jgi:hypothetical protein